MSTDEIIISLRYLYPCGFVGSRAELIVGPMGVIFRKENLDNTTNELRLKEDERVPIIEILRDGVTVKIFNDHVVVKNLSQYKAIKFYI